MTKIILSSISLKTFKKEAGLYENARQLVLEKAVAKSNTESPTGRFNDSYLILASSLELSLEFHSIPQYVYRFLAIPARFPQWSRKCPFQLFAEVDFCPVRDKSGLRKGIVIIGVEYPSLERFWKG